MNKLTAIIPTFNEESNIDAVISSVIFADEIIIVDSFSTDNTLNIAKKYDVRIIQRNYKNSASQKNWAIPQATHNWILIVDADERVSEELKDEIIYTLKKTKKNCGFWIRRENHFMGKKINFSGWQNDKVFRLFTKNFRYETKSAHAQVITNGNNKILKNKLIHYTFKSYNHYKNKINQYAIWQAEDFIKTKNSINTFHFYIKPVFRFLKHYIFMLGILDGKAGFQLSFLQAYGVYLRYKKVQEFLEKK